MKDKARLVQRLKTFLIFMWLMPVALRTQSPGNPIYLDAKQSIEARIDDLMSRMTLKEKIGQLNLPCVYVDQLGKTIPEKIAACKRFAAGTYTDEIGPGSGFFTLADTILHEGTKQQVEYFNELQKIALSETRLKIPLLQDEEGTQGSAIDAPDKVIALMTDFPTQSEPVSGLERGAIELSERVLRESYLPPWSAAITRNGALGVMAGYPEIEAVPAHGSEKWMTGVLRQELGFKGIVVSEGEGFGTLIYEGIVPTQKEAGALALRAGVDLNITYEPAYMGPLIENVEEGRVPMALVDRTVRRVLEQKFQLGLFEHPYVDASRAVRIVRSKEHQDLALQAGREGIVLLKNQNS